MVLPLFYFGVRQRASASQNKTFQSDFRVVVTVEWNHLLAKQTNGDVNADLKNVFWILAFAFLVC